MTVFSRSIQWLKKPFPQIESPRDIVLISLGSGAIVMAILVVFKPFGIQEIDRDMFLYLSGYSLIDILVTALLLLLPRIFPAWSIYRRWTTGKNLVAIICLLLAISVSNYFYGEYLAGRDYVEGFRELHRGGLLSWLFMTLSVGIIPLVFALYFIERRLVIRNQLRADEFNTAILNSSRAEEKTFIYLGPGDDAQLKLELGKFLCLRAEGGNYATVYWREENEVKKKLLRLTLTGFTDQVMSEESIVRCHKSYVINLDHVLSFQGNARSVSLTLNGLDFEVPVSRSFPREKLRKQT